MADTGRWMTGFSSASDNLVSAGGMGGLQRAMFLKQFGIEESERSKIRLESLKKGHGIYRNAFGQLRASENANLTAEELTVALSGFASEENLSAERVVAGTTEVMRIHAQLERALSENESPESKDAIYGMMDTNWNREDVNGFPNGLRHVPVNWREMYRNKLTFEKELEKSIPILISQAGKGDPDAFPILKGIFINAPKTVEKFGYDPKWSLSQMQEHMLSHEQKANLKLKDEEAIAQMRERVQRTGAVETQKALEPGVKELIDYKAQQEKPIRYSRVGIDENGNTVSYDPVSARNVVVGRDGQVTPYYGKVIPGTERPQSVTREILSLRKEFNTLPEVKNYSITRQSYDILKSAVDAGITEKNKIAVDQAVINMYNQIMQPNSVVMVSEYARTANDQALMNRLKGMASKIASGGAGLQKSDREAIMNMGEKFMRASKKKYQERLHEYKGYIANYNVDPNEYLNPSGSSDTEGSESGNIDLNQFIRTTK